MAPGIDIDGFHEDYTGVSPDENDTEPDSDVAAFSDRDTSNVDEYRRRTGRRQDIKDIVRVLDERDGTGGRNDYDDDRRQLDAFNRDVYGRRTGRRQDFVEKVEVLGDVDGIVRHGDYEDDRRQSEADGRRSKTYGRIDGDGKETDAGESEKERGDTAAEDKDDGGDAEDQQERHGDHAADDLQRSPGAKDVDDDQDDREHRGPAAGQEDNDKDVVELKSDDLDPQGTGNDREVGDGPSYDVGKDADRNTKDDQVGKDADAVMGNEMKNLVKLN